MSVGVGGAGVLVGLLWLLDFSRGEAKKMEKKQNKKNQNLFLLDC